MPYRSCIWILTGLVAAGASGHGDLHDRIDVITITLQASPTDPALLRKRAILHLEHEDWVAALSDVELARACGDLEDADLLRGRILLDARWYAAACEAFDAHCAHHPDEPRARRWRARAYGGAGRLALANREYAWVAANETDLAADFYLEWADAVGPEHAAHAIDLGLARIGPVVTLLERGIDLAIARGATDEAMVFVDALEHIGVVRGTVLRHRADILQADGQIADAHTTYLEARQAIADAPARTRRVLQSELARIERGIAATESAKETTE